MKVAILTSLLSILTTSISNASCINEVFSPQEKFVEIIKTKSKIEQAQEMTNYFYNAIRDARRTQQSSTSLLVISSMAMASGGLLLKNLILLNSASFFMAYGYYVSEHLPGDELSSSSEDQMIVSDVMTRVLRGYGDDFLCHEDMILNDLKERERKVMADNFNGSILSKSLNGLFLGKRSLEGLQRLFIIHALRLRLFEYKLEELYEIGFAEE